MHNVRRVQQQALSAEAIAAKREQELKSLETYKGFENAYLEHVCIYLTQRNNGDFTSEALESTTALLSLNPEYYSVWNYRREILLHLFEEAKEESQRVRARLLAEDLALTQQSMRTHPKVYWLWNHRRWCLSMLPNPGTDRDSAQIKWKKELALVDMMLNMDARNFMGWNYRRYVIAELAAAMLSCEAPSFPTSLSSDVLNADEKQAQLALAQDELQFTLRKIESNFSNFSAWHYRSKLLPRVWDALALDANQRGSEREKGMCTPDLEFELLQQAMYTDPSDQSIWIYHGWLVAQGMFFFSHSTHAGNSSSSDSNHYRAKRNGT